MTRRFHIIARTISFSTTLALAIGLAHSADSASADRPNIVLIVTDDQGWGDLSCHGNPVIDTPHIDALAQDGVGLTRFYVSPVCTPTRACLMTGRYNYRTRAIDTFKGRAMMEPAERTVAELLGEAGYATGIFGKWHLGDCYPMRPQDQGFDTTVVHRGGGLAQPSDPLENERRYTNPILFRNGEQFQADGYCTDVYFNEALRFIDEQTSANKPFFAYVATNAPHGPYHDVPEELYAKYQSRDLTPVLLGQERSADTVARVFAMVENIDQNVGRLLAELEDLQIADNTVVIFMCDNGPNTRRYVGPLRGMKSEVHEGGIRSPFFMRWPGKLEAGAERDQIAAHIDMLPTLLDIAGVEPPSDLRLDGRSLLPLLRSSEADWPQRMLVLQTHRGDHPVSEHQIAVVEQQWKLVHPSGFGREQPAPDTPFELYDLSSDPGEQENLADQRPAEVARLREAYQHWFRDVSSTRPDNYAPPRIVLGTDHETETTLTRQDWRSGGPHWEAEGWGEVGQWLVHSARPARYDVSVILQKPLQGAAELTIGQSVKKQPLDAPHQRIEFADVAIPAGDMAVACRILTDSGTESPYHVVLRRR